MIYFTADQHFSHENMIEYCNRPFKNTGIMERILTDKHNSIVTNDDTVYMLGDFSLRGAENITWYRHILCRLKGKKIFILGNHDKLNPFQYVECGFESVHTNYILNYSGQTYGLTHDPVCSICKQNINYWLCGHVHTLFKICGNVINVGVDMWDYKPVSIIYIQNEFNN